MDTSDFFEDLRFEWLNAKNWHQFVELFGDKGACGNCWCMHFRITKSEFELGKKNNGNKSAMKALVFHNQPTGIIALHQNNAIAWCALAPREDYLKLKNSRVHKRIDEKEVWSLPCTFVSKEFRHKGVSIALLKGVIQLAKERKIKTLEAYPLLPPKEKLPDAFAWVGLYSSFQKAGFEIVDHTSKNRPMVRINLTQ